MLYCYYSRKEAILMTKHRLFLCMIAVLALLCLCGCGDTVAVESSADGIKPFGMQTDPSATPSFGQTVAGKTSPNATVNTTTGGGAVIEGNSQPAGTTTAPSPSGSENSGTAGNAGTTTNTGTNTTTTPTSTPTKTPSNTSAPVSPSTAPSTAPTATPPQGVSTAKIEDITPYLGRSVQELINDLGYPYRSDYEDVDEGNPETDRIGTLYFEGFVVHTLRTQDGETVTDVQKATSNPLPVVSPGNSP